jgi:hypothetical protein
MTNKIYNNTEEFLASLEETEDLSDYDDETYDDLDKEPEFEVEYEGFLEFDEKWNEIDEIDDFQFIED